MHPRLEAHPRRGEVPRVVGFRAGLTTLFVCLLCALPHLASAQAPAVQLTRGPENHLLIPAQVNGRPANLLLDTGSKINFLQADRAQHFGARPTGGELHSGGRAFPAAAIDELRIGPVTLGAAQVGLFNPAQFRGPVPGKGGKAADGIIGADLLRRYGAIINCRTQQLFFTTASTAPLNLAATTRALGFVRVPLQPTSRGLISVPCSIGSNAGALAIDTGAFVTVFDAAAVSPLQLAREPSTLTARTAGGRVRALELARVERLRIGDVPVDPQRFAVMDMFPKKKPLRTFTGINRIEFYDARAWKARREIWGLLGNELLYQHHAIIDLDRFALYLK